MYKMSGDLCSFRGLKMLVTCEPGKQDDEDCIAAREKNTVDHPNHYTVGGLEAIAFMQAKLTPEQYEGFLAGNALKYLLRYSHKGNALEDLKKARWFLDRLITTHERSSLD